MSLAGLDKGREQARASLESMFNPRVIAVVGASRDPAKWGRRILEYTGRAGFSGALYGVNPGVADLNLPRVTTVAALADIGQPIDLAVLARPASTTAELLDECAALGVKSVLVTAAGFGELGGEHLAAEQRIVARAREAGIRLLGPNTFGMFVAASGVNLTPREHIPPGSVAMLSQSGNVVVGMYEQARQAGIGFSACVGVGNQVDVGLGELLAYFADDPASAVIAVYVEGLRGSGAEFRAGLAACRAAGKPVVVLKSGRSGHAASAVATHTGALASDERVWQAILADAGAIQVESTQDLGDTLAVACSVGRHRGRAMVLTDGGGDSVMAIDWLTASGLSMATLSAQTRAGLDKLIPAAAPRVEARNPVTLDTAGGAEDDPMLLARCAWLAARDGGVDLIVVGGLFGGYPKMLDSELACAAELIELHQSGHPVVMQSAFALSDAEPLSRLKKAGITVLPAIDRIARALSRTLLPPTSADGVRAEEAGQSAPAAGPVVLPVTESAELLRQSGIDLPPMSVVWTPRELAAIAATASYPACVKIADTAVAHKSDVGGVLLNLADATEVETAAGRLWARLPGSPLLVMPSLPGGTEFLVGTGNDQLFGPFVIVGKGGVWAETDADLAILMTPVDEESARRALLSLRCAPTFTGRRGRPAIDLTAMAGLIVAMSRLAAKHPGLSVEANPVIAYTDGCAVADLRASRQTGQCNTK
jgi:acetate---CoA ligase (ADP-forming)